MKLAAIKDWVDTLSKLAIPFVLAWIGFLVVRRVETQKAVVARSSDFKRRWADNFYEISQDFMRSVERYASILFHLQSMADVNGPFGTKLQEELNMLNVRLGELHLGIKRLAYFAPSEGGSAIANATAVQDYLGEIVRSMKGNFDKLITLQNEFNQSAREAHAEMLAFD